jgi:hypothetical protein
MMIDPRAAMQLALTGGDASELLSRLVFSLRAGLSRPRLRDVAAQLQLPTESEALALFGTAGEDASTDSTVQHTQNLPKEALSVETSLPTDAGAPDTAGRMVALMVQDMAAFGGGVGRESVRLAARAETYNFDYFA